MNLETIFFTFLTEFYFLKYNAIFPTREIEISLVLTAQEWIYQPNDKFPPSFYFLCAISLSLSGASNYLFKQLHLYRITCWVKDMHFQIHQAETAYGYKKQS